MMDELIRLDRELFLFFNGLHTPALDMPMFYLTKTFVWVPFYAALLYLIIRTYKLRSWTWLVGIALAITLADQITSTLMKPYFARPRPSHEPDLQGLVHIVNGYAGGQYGFASSHAADTFAVAMFFFLLFRKTHRWIGWIFLWACLVTYTRIYLGVHYPGDVLCGAIIGLMAGWLSYRAAQKLHALIVNKQARPAS